jgi:hypothetical protein
LLIPLLEKVEQNEPQLLEKVESKNNTYLVIPFSKVYQKVYFFGYTFFKGIVERYILKLQVYYNAHSK